MGIRSDVPLPSCMPLQSCMPLVNGLVDDALRNMVPSVNEPLLQLVTVANRFLSRVSILTRDIDTANLSVRPSVSPSVLYVPIPDENGLTYRHSFFTIR